MPMQRLLTKSKIHRATVTAVDLDYEGSMTVDERLLEAADIVPYEQVQVVNINNGARFETYVIPGPRGAGDIKLNGAAARLGMVNDRVIVISYAQYNEQEMRDHKPRIVQVDDHNAPVGLQLAADA